MFTIQRRAQCVLWYHELKSPAAAQLKFRKEFEKDLPGLKRWFEKFMGTGSVIDRKKSSRSRIDEEAVDAARVAFLRTPRKSVRVASKNFFFVEAQFTKFYKNDFGSMLTRFKLFKLSSQMIDPAEQLLLKKFFSAQMMTMTRPTLTVWLKFINRTKNLFLNYDYYLNC